MVLFVVIVCLTMAAFAFMQTTDADAVDGWGSVEGQFLFDGEMPEVPPLAMREDYAEKGSEYWDADSITDESLLVDAESRGVANIFIYLQKAPERIHPDLVEPAEKEIEFTASGCRFVPNALAARIEQVVRWNHDGRLFHSIRAPSSQQERIGMALQPMPEDGIPYEFSQAEIVPSSVICDMHPWMLAYWLVTDNPYFAITDAEGRFRIDNLPEGEHTFTVWHERSGYVETPRFTQELTLNVVPRKTVTLEPFEVPAAAFDR